MLPVPLHPIPVPSRTASAGQLAAIRRKVAVSDAVGRLLAELAFSAHADRIPTEAH